MHPWLPLTWRTKPATTKRSLSTPASSVGNYRPNNNRSRVANTASSKKKWAPVPGNNLTAVSFMTSRARRPAGNRLTIIRNVNVPTPNGRRIRRIKILAPQTNKTKARRTTAVRRIKNTGRRHTTRSKTGRRPKPRRNNNFLLCPAPAPATPNRPRKNSPLNALLKKHPSHTAAQLLANYQKRMQRRVRNMEHAQGRLELQINRLRKRPNLASHMAEAQRNLANAKRVSQAVHGQLNNALRGVWSEGPVTYHGPVYHRTSWAPGPWRNRAKSGSARFTARNRLLGSETLNRYHHNQKSRVNAAQNALKALTNATRPLTPQEVELLQQELSRVQAKYNATGRLFAHERKLLANGALVNLVSKLYNTNNRPVSNSNALTPNNLPDLLPLLNAARNKEKRGLPLNERNKAILARSPVLEDLMMRAAFNAPPPPNTRLARRRPTIGNLVRAGHL